jgi:anhydro-N-acetylmuramic acid kinase
MHSVLGLMSGTSCDGLDIAFCRFRRIEGSWAYEIVKAETVPYDASMKSFLAGLASADAHGLAAGHVRLGRWFGERANEFLKKHKLEPELVASHGHTVFHEPEQGLTFQAGCGAALAAVAGVETACDFRTLDMALGGQGAPLVPIGDKLLFGEYAACLNLGGIANVSYDDANGRRIAFDVCPANMALNELAGQLGLPYDAEGKRAAAGNTDKELLARLNALPFYRKPPPRSLGREWYESEFRPLLASGVRSAPDALRTVTEHIAVQVAKALEGKPGRLLVTGGGAFNRFLVERLAALAPVEIHVPGDELVKFKEAMVFAFLGLLRKRGEINTLSSVTGSATDSSGGALYGGR